MNLGPRPAQGLLRASLDVSQSFSSALSWGCNIPQVPPIKMLGESSRRGSHLENNHLFPDARPGGPPI